MSRMLDSDEQSRSVHRYLQDAREALLWKLEVSCPSHMHVRSPGW